MKVNKSNRVWNQKRGKKREAQIAGKKKNAMNLPALAWECIAHTAIEDDPAFIIGERPIDDPAFRYLKPGAVYGI